MRHAALHLLPALVLAAGAVCSGPVQADTGGIAQGGPAYTESGQASWYGPRHEGLRTTSGERFDSSKMTAAHSSLPMGSYVRVTEQRFGRSVVVRVNDREPPHGVRCIDLSHAAAQQLGIASRGVADVVLAQLTRQEATEIAEAPDDSQAADSGSVSAEEAHAIVRHGRRHTRHARR